MPKLHSFLSKANSLHPHIISHLTVEAPPNNDNCALDIIYELPPSVFVDVNQLADFASLIGNATVFGETDLEAPLEHVKDKRGSVVILRQPFTREPKRVIDVPLHLRYQQPSLTETQRPIEIPLPVAGWTCHKLGQSAPYPPLDAKYSLVQAIDRNAYFTAIDPPTDGVLQLGVPVGDVKDRSFVEVGTLSCVVLCTVWILVAVYKSLAKRNRIEAKGKRRKSE
ncbi:PIG-X [Radiomyces spectabilis]|uniref:PIG-X n=1 Tax=Radiomyces spectabilis TaxID=64574 RepID=UPI00221F16C6|nr:PIG-X [Radiomyces spectabilis]KAI8370611.1 PIG-X [Radiomyces spectabilis]